MNVNETIKSEPALLYTFKIVMDGKKLRIKSQLQKENLSMLEVQVSISDAVNAFMCVNFGIHWRNDYKALKFYNHREVSALVVEMIEYFKGYLNELK